MVCRKTLRLHGRTYGASFHYTRREDESDASISHEKYSCFFLIISHSRDP